MNAPIHTDHLAPVVALVRELYELADLHDDKAVKAIALRLYARIAVARTGLGLQEIPIHLNRPEGNA